MEKNSKQVVDTILKHIKKPGNHSLEAKNFNHWGVLIFQTSSIFQAEKDLNINRQTVKKMKITQYMVPNTVNNIAKS